MERRKKFLEDVFFFGDRPKNVFENLFLFFFALFLEIAWKNFWRPFFFGEHLCLCPWSWPREGLSLTLTSEFFCVLGHEPCVLDSTSVTELVLNKFRKTVKKNSIIPRVEIYLLVPNFDQNHRSYYHQSAKSSILSLHLEPAIIVCDNAVR